MKHIGIGFVTGRKQFQTVLKSYISNWLEHGLVSDDNIRLHLFIAYDLKYQKTRISDYKNVPPELARLVESINFLGASYLADEKDKLKKANILSDAEAELLFGDGYAKKRNVVMYAAVKNKMDHLIFLDDDEYPLGVSKTEAGRLTWMGQSVVGTHLKYIDSADITHGHHCGYISPIPHIDFNDGLKESDFRLFIEAISNDIISWEKIKKVITESHGVTFASHDIINDGAVSEVAEEKGMKFISGGNLCINFKNASQLPPFYNPPGARGEDTFMSTCLSDLVVLKVPCYTFHDGFGMYNHILNGVLPISLNPILNSPGVTKRFVNAALGWIRYKPLLVYITQREDFLSIMQDMEKKLLATVPKLCKYFGTDELHQILKELDHYSKKVVQHFDEFTSTKAAWSKLMLKWGS
jgi:hypothetical protein